MGEIRSEKRALFVLSLSLVYLVPYMQFNDLGNFRVLITSITFFGIMEVDRHVHTLDISSCLLVKHS